MTALIASLDVSAACSAFCYESVIGLLSDLRSAAGFRDPYCFGIFPDIPTFESTVPDPPPGQA